MDDRKDDRAGASGRTREIFAKLLVTLVTLALLAAGHREIHRRHVLALDNHGWTVHSREPRHPRESAIGQEILGEIGWVKGYGPPAPSSYLELSVARAPDVRRIGIFGGSFVEGCEASPGHDFPTQLQRSLKSPQILNFGVSMYGLHQIVRLWERVGRSYDLQEVVLFPEDCHLERDSTFLYSSRAFGPVHGRYVAGPAGPGFVAIPGKDATERSLAYFSWLPRLDVLRYDRRLPSSLQCLVGASEQRRNPFYHEPDLVAEMERLDEALLVRVAQESPGLVLPCLDGWSLALARRVAARAPADCYASAVPGAIRAALPLYAAPFGHMSANGNALLARELHQFLEGRDGVRFPRLRLERLDPASVPPARATTANDLACFEIAGRPMMSFRRRGLHPPHDDDPLSRSVASMARSSLVLVNPADPGRPVFLPLERSALATGPVTLRFTLAGRERSAVVGRLERTSARTGVLRMESAEGAGWRLEASPATSDDGEGPSLLLHAESPPDTVSLDVAGIAASLRVIPRTGGARLALEPLLRPRTVAGQFLDVESLPPRGTVDFVAPDEHGIARAYPCLAYRIEEHGAPVFERPRRSRSGTATRPVPSP